MEGGGPYRQRAEECGRAGADLQRDAEAAGRVLGRPFGLPVAVAHVTKVVALGLVRLGIGICAHRKKMIKRGRPHLSYLILPNLP